MIASGVATRMTTGGYLARRRAAAGLVPADVDTMLGWEAGSMADIEGRLKTTPESLVEALHGAFPFDPVTMRRLGEGSEVRICHACACSQWDACWDAATETSCHWVAASLCSDCQAKGVI